MPPDFHIMLVEDSPTDVKIIERAFRESKIDHRLTVIFDGQLAVDYLIDLHDPTSPPEQVPDLILLDLNLPGLDGTQVLATIKNDSYLKAIPVVVLTTSNRDEDVLLTYLAGANTYVPKPAEFSGYLHFVDVLRAYWQETALRPRRDRPRP